MAETLLPPDRANQRLGDDPRAATSLWPPFVRCTLRNGELVRDDLIAAPSFDSYSVDTTGDVRIENSPNNIAPFKREPSQFTNQIGPREASDRQRFHLWVSGVCPWASGVRAIRHLLKLEDFISMEIADGQTSSGWCFVAGTSCQPWCTRGKKPFYLFEAYQLSDQHCTSRITVPVLWDKKEGKIVSNDSFSIIKMLCTCFASSSASSRSIGLFPVEKAMAIDSMHQYLYDGILNGVYECGVSFLRGNRYAALESAIKCHDTLQRLEHEVFSRRSFVMENCGLTVVDIRLFMCLIRFDAAYASGFRINELANCGTILGTKSNYPNIRNFLRRVYREVCQDVDWESFSQYFRWAPFPTDQSLPDLKLLKEDVEKPTDMQYPAKL